MVTQGRFQKTQMLRVNAEFAETVRQIAARDGKTVTEVTRDLAEMLRSEVGTDKEADK